MKRAIDLVVSAVALAILWPLLFALALAVRWDSQGPAIFKQMRVGRNGAQFRLLKLRTMRQGAPQLPTHQASASEVTRLGSFLRRSKLDELPQLWNVLLGEMSLVGPRPCLPSQAELVAERAARGVLALRPGITGLAQSRGIDMSDPVRLATVDGEYLSSRSALLDLKILWRTLTGQGGRGDRIGRRRP